MQFSESGGREFEQHPTGMFTGRCIKIIDLGTQTGVYLGEPTQRPELILMFESDALMTEGDDAGKPFVISSFYTASMHPKASLRKAVESWLGTAFAPGAAEKYDFHRLLGKPCYLNIIHKINAEGKAKARIGGVMQAPANAPAKQPVNPLVYFSLQDFDSSVFAKLSDKIKEKIASSPEYKRITTGGYRPATQRQTTAPFDGQDDTLQSENIPF